MRVLHARFFLNPYFFFTVFIQPQYFRCVPFSRLFLPGATTCNPLETDVRFKVQPLSFHLSPPTPPNLALTAFFSLHRLDRQSQQPIHQKTSYALFLTVYTFLFLLITDLSIFLWYILINYNILWWFNIVFHYLFLIS